jgi:hypothetical protein
MNHDHLSPWLILGVAVVGSALAAIALFSLCWVGRELIAFVTWFWWRFAQCFCSRKTCRNTHAEHHETLKTGNVVVRTCSLCGHQFVGNK